MGRSEGSGRNWKDGMNPMNPIPEARLILFGLQFW